MDEIRELDHTDRRILQHLQENGRLMNLELANAVNLSASPCLRRVKRLESEGYIQRYAAIVDPEKMGLDVTAFTRVTLEKHNIAQLDSFQEAVAAWPEVMECYLMTGEIDFQLRVLVASMRAYERFLREKLYTIDGISKVQTSFSFRPVVYRTALPTS